MKYKYTGLVLLGIWLVLQGLEGIFDFYVPHEDKILPFINLFAGLILSGYCIKLKHGDIGLFLLGCWATLNSGLFLFHYSFQYSSIIVQVLGVAAGIMLILKK